MPDNEAEKELQSAGAESAEAETGTDQEIEDQDALFEAYSKGESPDAVTGQEQDKEPEPVKADAGAEVKKDDGETDGEGEDNDYSFIMSEVNGAGQDGAKKDVVQPVVHEQEKESAAKKSDAAAVELTIEAIMSRLPESVQAHYMDYPEDQQATFAIARVIAEETIKRTPEFAEMKKLYAELKAEKASVLKAKEEAIMKQLQSELDTELKKTNPDYEQVIRKDKAFAEWLKKQPAGIKQMCVPDNFETPQEAARNISSVLNMYEATKSNAAQKQDKKNSIYSGAGKAMHRDTAVTTDDEEAMFNEIASKLK